MLGSDPLFQPDASAFGRTRVSALPGLRPESHSGARTFGRRRRPGGGFSQEKPTRDETSNRRTGQGTQSPSPRVGRPAGCKGSFFWDRVGGHHKSMIPMRIMDSFGPSLVPVKQQRCRVRLSLAISSAPKCCRICHMSTSWEAHGGSKPAHVQFNN